VRITANQVTLARIILLPVPVYMLIYGGKVEWWIAFAIFLLLGATDFVDGLMARHEGPTTLGALIDPVADKIFVAAIILTLSALGIFPPWMVGALLSRELLMTALRSSVAIRKHSIKTSKLAKLKTIVQMGGLGTIFFTIVMPNQILALLCLILSLPFLLVALFYLFNKKPAPFWALPVFGAFLLVGLWAYFFSKDSTLAMQMTIIIAITWISALDYLVQSYKLFRRTGMDSGDWWRILWSISHGILVAPLVAHYPALVLPLLASISLEFALGGIDNIVLAQKRVFSWWPFAVSAIAGLIFSAWVYYHHIYQLRIDFLYESLALLLVSFGVSALAFVRNIELFKHI